MDHRTQLDNVGAQLTDELWAILDEHLPAGMVQTAKDKVEALQANMYALCEKNDQRLYRALMGFIPQHESEVHAAFAGTLFDGDVCDQRHFYRWAAEIEWTESPQRITEILDRLGS